MRLTYLFAICCLAVLAGGCAQKELCPGEVKARPSRSGSNYSSNARVNERKAKPSLIHITSSSKRKPAPPVYTSKATNKRKPPAPVAVYVSKETSRRRPPK